MKMPLILIIAAAIFVLFTNAFYKVKETEQVIITQFGELTVSQCRKPG